MSPVNNFGVLLPTRGRTGLRCNQWPKGGTHLADGRDRRAGRLRLRLGRLQHHLQAAIQSLLKSDGARLVAVAMYQKTESSSGDSMTENVLAVAVGSISWACPEIMPS